MAGGDAPLDLPEVVVSFTLRRSEFLNTWYRWYGRRYAKFIALMLGLAGAGAVTGQYVVPVLIGLWLVLCVGLWPIRFWRHSARVRDRQTFGFSSDGTWSRLLHVNSEYDWSYWNEVSRAGSTYVLRSPVGLSFIPQRAFGSPDEEQRFCDFATARIEGD